MRSVVRFAVISACKLNGTAFTHLVVSGSSIKQLVLEKFILGAAEHVMQNLMILNEAAAPTFQLGGPTLTCMCAHMAWGEIFIIDFFLLLLIIILVKHDKTLVYKLQLTPKPHGRITDFNETSQCIRIGFCSFPVGDKIINIYSLLPSKIYFIFYSLIPKQKLSLKYLKSTSQKSLLRKREKKKLQPCQEKKKNSVFP